MYIRYTALGDSLTVGVGAPPGCGFVSRYSAILGRRFQMMVLTENIGVNGATTGRIAQLLAGDLDIRWLVKRADVITLTAGGNDLIQAGKRYLVKGDHQHFVYALERCAENYAKIINMISSLKSDNASPYIIRAVDLYNPFPQIPEGTYWVNQFNRHIHSFAGGNVRVATIFGSFNGMGNVLLSADRVHPNANGYEVIAEQVSRLGYSPLA